MAKENWQKHLSVDRRIVRLLSVFTYEDFPRAIREMVSNAYDADATDVKITINIFKDIIEVTDDGNGMTPEEFDFFLRIAGQQRARRNSPEFRRTRIGQFGIGFLAVFPFGKKIKITSTARRSDLRFEATIPAERYVQEGSASIDLEEIPVVGFQEQSPDIVEEHGTTIRITGLSEMTKRYFKRPAKKKSRKQSIRDWPPEQRLRWSLCEDLPIDYADKSPYKEAFSNLGSSGLRVHLNGDELKRNAPGSYILEADRRNFDGAECQYVIATDWKVIQPVENRYLKQRIRNVGIGDRTAFGLGLEGKTYSRLSWLTGEVRILGGFDDLVSIDRERFIDSASFDSFRDFFNKRLSHFALFLESVSEAKRDIERQFKSSRFAEVGTKREVVERNINKLVGKGFEVVRHSADNLSRRESNPVIVDVRRKRVEIVDGHPAFRDTITVNSKEIPVRYIPWGHNGNRVAPVRRARDGAIEINTSYPLFKSGRYGEFFKKILVVMLLVSEKSHTNPSLMTEVAYQLQKEFSDLT